MRKRILAIILCALLILSIIPINLSANDSTIMWSFNSNTGVLSISGNGYMTDYSNENKAPWDSYRTQITSVEVGEGVLSLGDYAFDSCGNMTSITLPSTLESIGEFCFFFCTSLLEINIPASVQSVPGNAFSSCTALASINVDTDSLYLVDVDGVLYDKDMKTIICYPKGHSGTGYEIPGGVVTIGDNAFRNVVSLTSITIPNTVKTIGEMSFFYCSGLKSVTIPPSVTEIEAGAFSYCTSLSDVNIVYGVIDIGASVFSNCRALVSLLIPSSVETIGFYCFGQCENLEKLTIGRNLSYIADSAFYECDKFNEVRYYGTSVELNQISVGVENTAYVNAVKYCDVHTSHTLSDYFYNYDAKCEVDATKTRYCSCGDVNVTETVSVPGTALTHNFSEWKMVVEPTPTVNGEKSRSCSICGKIENEVLSYDEALDPAVKNARFFVAITLNDSIDMNLEIRQIGDSFENDKLNISVDGSPVKFTYKDNIASAVLASKAATKMGESIHCVIKYNGLTLKSFDFSVKDYCVRNLSSSDANLANLCKATLNYGACAQLAFNYDTEHLVNKDCEIKEYDDIATQSTVKFENNDVITDFKASMTLESSIQLNFKFTSAKPLTVSDFKVKNQKGETVINRISFTDLGDGVYQITIRNISASKLSNVYTVEVEGVSVKYGAYNYCYNAQDKKEEKFTDEIKTLCKSIYNYGLAASAYFAN